jgi:hypothetical protein
MKAFLRRLIAGLLLAGSAHAAVPDTPALYSHTMPVQFQGRGSLVQLRLPKDVYLHARSGTLDDVRLFDGQGRSIPFALTMPAAQRERRRRTTPAKVFALGAQAVATTGRVAIRTSMDGSLLSVESRPGKPVPALGGLLLDMGEGAARQPMINALVFTAPPNVANYSAHMTIEASADLQDWQSVGEGRLDWLSNSSSDTLANNRIAFEPHRMRYVRLRWLEGEPHVFGAIAAERDVPDAAAATPDTMLVQAQPGEFPGDLVYPVGRAVPLRSIGMRLPEMGMVVPSEIGRYVELPTVPGAARRPGAPRWQFAPLLRTTFYNIAQDGSVRTPADLTLEPLSVDRLVVRPLTPLASKPALQIGWLPATLVFAAREAGPYTLAVGRPQAISAAARLSDVAPGYRPAELLTIAAAVAGPVMVQHAAQETSDAASAGLSATARTAVLWGVLLLGVGVLALLSWRMMRQLPAVEAGANADGDGDGQR